MRRCEISRLLALGRENEAVLTFEMKFVGAWYQSQGFDVICRSACLYLSTFNSRLWKFFFQRPTMVRFTCVIGSNSENANFWNLLEPPWLNTTSVPGHNARPLFCISIKWLFVGTREGQPRCWSTKRARIIAWMAFVWIAVKRKPLWSALISIPRATAEVYSRIASRLRWCVVSFFRWIAVPKLRVFAEHCDEWFHEECGYFSATFWWKYSKRCFLYVLQKI